MNIFQITMLSAGLLIKKMLQILLKELAAFIHKRVFSGREGKCLVNPLSCLPPAVITACKEVG